MARPKIHGERVEWKIRIPTDIAERVERARGELDRNAFVLRSLVHELGGIRGTGTSDALKSEKSMKQPPITPPTSPQKPVPVPRKEGFQVPVTDCKHPLGHVVRRGADHICPSCGHKR